MRRPLTWLVPAGAVAMPLVAIADRLQLLGPDVGTVSARTPTLLDAAGYAFAIWGVIFALDLGFAVWQATRLRRADAGLARMRPGAALAFWASAAWMPAFSQQAFEFAFVLILLALLGAVQAALAAARAPADSMAGHWPARWALGLHAGWLLLATLLDAAQLAVARGWVDNRAMLAPTLALWAGGAVALVVLNRRLRAHPALPIAALWGLAGVVAAQGDALLPGAQASAIAAGAVAALLFVQSTLLLWRERDRIGLRNALAGSIRRTQPVSVMPSRTPRSLPPRTVRARRNDPAERKRA